MLYCYSSRVPGQVRDDCDRALIAMSSSGSKVYGTAIVISALRVSEMIDDTRTLTEKGLARRETLLRA